MRKSLLFLFVSLLFFTSCKTENANKIELFNGFAFHVGAYERVLDIDSLVKKSYEQSFNNIPNIQVPLFRIVSGKDYQIYLGIPFHISPEIWQ